MTGKRTKVTNSEPDYAHWSKMTVLTKSEAIALLLNIDPNSIDPEKPLPVKNEEAKKLQALLSRAFESGAFPNSIRISPEELVSWAASNQLQAPQGFMDALKKQGRHLQIGVCHLKIWKLITFVCTRILLCKILSPNNVNQVALFPERGKK